MKRFYKSVATAATENGFAVTLDGKPIKTPKGNLVAIHVEAFAEAVADEWRAQEEDILPPTMPMTRLVNTGIDGGRDRAEEVMEDLVRFGGTDLMCYRADNPKELVDRQEAQWQPLLDWAAEHHSVRLVTQTGITPVDQPETSLKTIREVFHHIDGFTVDAAHLATCLTGSVVIALALVHGRLDADTAWVAARVDEDWQIEQWGTDEEAADKARAAKSELDAAVAVMRLLGHGV